jgi:biopolymer transport protein ExbD
MAFTTGSNAGEVNSEINITPLVDVMLVLLVAFIITAPALSNAVKINLPKTAATAPLTDVKPITISVDGDSKIYINKEEISIEALEFDLKGRVIANPDLPINFQADEGVPYRQVAKAIATIQRSGATKLSVLTQPSGG